MKIQNKIMLIALIVMPSLLFGQQKNDAVIILQGININKSQYLPVAKVLEYGIVDERVNVTITPEVSGNRAFYRFTNLTNNTAIQFSRLDSVNINLSSVPKLLVSPGDSIDIVSNENLLRFSGTGQEKFECLYMLRQIEDDWNKNSLGDDSCPIEKNFNLLDKQEVFLKKYIDKLDRKTYHWILNELRLSNQLSSYWLLRFRKKDIKDYEDAIKMVKERDTWIDKEMLSHRYPAYYLTKYIFDLKESKNSRFNFDTAFDYIESSFSGTLKEQLLTYLIKKELKSSTISQKQLTSLDSFENPFLKNYIKILIHGKIAGMNAPYFSLTGVDGTKITYDEFAGKVIVMDFWFTGCGACTLIPPIFGPIAESFKNNDDVVFMSISIDKDMDIWKKSIENGKYTFDNSIKLYTDGLGRSHPIMVDYNVEGCPTIILISKGGEILPIPVNPRFDNGKSLKQSIINDLESGSSLN